MGKLLECKLVCCILSFHFNPDLICYYQGISLFWDQNYFASHILLKTREKERKPWLTADRAYRCQMHLKGSSELLLGASQTKHCWPWNFSPLLLSHRTHYMVSLKDSHCASCYCNGSGIQNPAVWKLKGMWQTLWSIRKIWASLLSCQNEVVELHVYPNVHHSTVYNSQDMEAT